jgi:hypothetical protein
MMDRSFFGLNFYERYRNNIRDLRLIDCYNNGNFKTQQKFAAMGLPISANVWFCLSGAIKKAVKRYKKTDHLLEEKQETLLHFLKKLKKAQKKSERYWTRIRSINHSQKT